MFPIRRNEAQSWWTSKLRNIAIGEAYGMEHRQVLKYMHAAKDAGMVTPMYSSPNGIIRGWMPAAAPPCPKLAEQKAAQAATVVKELRVADGLVSTDAVARQLNVPEGTVARWLAFAQRMGLVRSKGGYPPESCADGSARVGSTQLARAFLDQWRAVVDDKLELTDPDHPDTKMRPPRRPACLSRTRLTRVPSLRAGRSRIRSCETVAPNVKGDARSR